jgi:hypothetical protein
LQEYPLRPDRSQSVIVPKLVRCLLAASFSRIASEAKRKTQKIKRTANDSEFPGFPMVLTRPEEVHSSLSRAEYEMPAISAMSRFPQHSI